jgi:hypothetical protein
MRQGSGKVYRIVVRSELSKRYATAFEGIDQPHLYGILDRISGLGLELVSVSSLSEEIQNDA